MKNQLSLLAVASLLYPTAGLFTTENLKAGGSAISLNQRKLQDLVITKTYLNQDQYADFNVRGASSPGQLSSYVADFGGTGSWVEWEVETPECILYTLSVRYQAGANRPVNLYVDGVVDGEVPTTGNNWSEWKMAEKEVTLGCNGAASHIIRLQADNSKGPNIDALTVTYEIPDTDSPSAMPSLPPVPTMSPAPSSSQIPTYAPTFWNKGEVIEGGYNLILTQLRCSDTTLDWPADNCCPNLLPGIHLPDHDEKFVMMMAITARMFPEAYVHTIYTPYFTFKAGDGTCGQAAETPYYLSFDGMEHGRYYAKSVVECPSPIPAPHKTCPDDCGLFGGACERTRAFRDGSNGFINSEALCGNLVSCFATSNSHCSLIFNPDRNFFSIGTYPGTGLVINGWRTLVDSNKRHALTMSSHFNRAERAVRTIEEGDNSEALVLQTTYYDPANTALKGYVLYQGERHLMSVLHGSETRGIWEYQTPIPNDGCEAYYFVFELGDGATIRLPEDPHFMFGTSGIGSCTENHYFDVTGEGSFAANAGPNYPGDTPCSGCNRAVLLDYENGILLETSSDAPTTNPIVATSSIPSISPTIAPTTSVPSANPIATTSTKPSVSPTISPTTDLPTIFPTVSMSAKPSVLPTISPTTDFPTVSMSTKPSSSTTAMRISGVKKFERKTADANKYKPKLQVVVKDLDNNKVGGVEVVVSYNSTKHTDNRPIQLTKKTHATKGRVTFSFPNVQNDYVLNVELISVVKEGYEYDESRNRYVSSCPLFTSACPTEAIGPFE